MMGWEQDGYATPSQEEWEAFRRRDEEDRRLEEGTPYPDWTFPDPRPHTQDKNVDEATDAGDHRD